MDCFTYFQGGFMVTTITTNQKGVCYQVGKSNFCCAYDSTSNQKITFGAIVLICEGIKYYATQRRTKS